MIATARNLSDLLDRARVPDATATGPDPEIAGLAMDSRAVLPGSLFLAIAGLKHDGEGYVDEAVARGACAVLARSPRPPRLDPGVAWIQVEEPRLAAARLAREWHGRPDEAVKLVGVTGTNGKTTVTYLVEAIAQAAGRSPGRIGTVSVAFGGREVEAARTTPDSLELYGVLGTMRDAGVDLVAMEVSSHGLALGRVEGARFAVAALTNIGRDHLDFHVTLDAYVAAKARLFEALDRDAVAVLPADDPAGEVMAGRTRARVLTFGRSAGAAVRLREERCGPGGSEALLDTPAGAIAVRTLLPGRVNLENVAAGAACALAAGLPPEAVSLGVPALELVPGRFERIDAGQPFALFVDYAHTEAALRRLLSNVRELVHGRVIVVFGCGGERDRGKRPEMGRAAAEGADRIVLTSDNPRGEDPGAILSEIEAGLSSVAGGRERCLVIPDRREAVRQAVRLAQPGDAVVIAGKGHETTQSAGDRVTPLDDRELAGDALAAAGWSGGGDALA